MSERLGGLPFGLPEDQWPKCSECGNSQSLLAQFEHHPERLDLGKVGRTLYIFQCNHDPGMCATWEAFSGANACLIVEPEDKADAETPSPADAPLVENFAVIQAWQECDDQLLADQAEKFYSERTFLELAPEQTGKVTWSTRLGGVPCWMQSPDETPKPGWRFVAQLDSTYSFLSQPRFSKPWIRPDPERFEGRTHVGQGPNFGDGGLAYVFVNLEADPPKAAMFWQCG